MNSKILRTMLLAAILIFCIGAVQASDVNITDCDTITTSENADIQLEITQESIEDNSLQQESSEELSDLASVDSNTLSTDEENAPQGNYIKYETKITEKISNIYYKGSYQITLTDSNADMPLSNKSISFIINDVKYSAVTDSNGIASVDLKLTPGKYTAQAYFEGDDEYEPSNNLTSKIEILPTIEASSVTKYYKGSTQYIATFYNSQGKALANSNVTITVDGKTYTKKTNSKGVVKLSIDLKPGTYKVVAKDPVTGYKLTTTFKILSTISAKDMNKVYTDLKKFKATFYKSNGKALAKKQVKFKINGRTYKVKTNSKGVASLSLVDLPKGTHKIISYNPDGLTKTNKVKVVTYTSSSLNSKDYTFLKKDKKVIKAQLLNKFGYAPGKGKTIKITVNGKTYTKQTNVKGYVYLKLPSLKKGIYTVKYKFSGNAFYKASSTKKKVSVLTSKKSAFKVKSTTTFGYGAGTKFKVAVTAGGVPVINKEVTFTLDNKSYVKTTDGNGIASLPINSEIGNHTVKYSIKKDSKVNGKSGSTDIKIKKRTGSTVTWKSGTSFTDDSQTFKVLLKDVKGNPISGETVKITINSKTYSGKTDSKGYAKIKAHADIGTYKASVKYPGGNKYLPNSTTKKIKISPSNLIKGVNEKNTIKDLKPYLKATTNCQVGNSKIKSLVNSLTKGLTSDVDKATAIFNYVRDSISYSFYYDTQYGAVGTLNVKHGNCVDHSHLLVAMFRTAGLAARYVHGSCTFSSGSTYGHVWAQVLIGDTWICADATSSRNSLGNIVNWNTKSFSLNSRYASLPF